MSTLSKATLSITALFAASLLVGCESQPKSIEPVQVAPLTLTVAHINDTHSNFEPLTRKWQPKVLNATTVESQVGGYPRLATALKEARQRAKDKGVAFLALHGGDAFQGSLYFSLYKGSANQRLLNEFGLDAMVIGNHEFDLGDQALLDFASGTNFPVLAANMEITPASVLSQTDNIKPYIIKELNGHKVGIFGLVLEDLPKLASPGKGLKFDGEVKSAQATVDKLVSLGVNHIVMVSHIGLDRDLRIAEQVNGVDLIVGGHSHTLLGDFTDFGLADIEGYAAMHTNPNGGKTCVVQAGEYAQAAGELTVKFNDYGQIVSCDGSNRLLFSDKFKVETDAGAQPASAAVEEKLHDYIEEHPRATLMAEDSTTRELIERDYAPGLAAYSSKVIAQVVDDNDPVDKTMLDHVRIPGKSRGGASLAVTGSEAAAVVAAAFAWKVPHADMVIINAGGVRAPIVGGSDGITAGYVLGTLLPFNGTLSTVQMRGDDIKAMLEHVINNSTNPNAVSDGGFPAMANLKVSYNGKLAEGERLEYVKLCPKQDFTQCQRLQDNEVYTVLTSTFLAGGKDGYDAFVNASIGKPIDTGFVDSETMIEYATDKGILTEIPTGMTFVPADFAKGQIDKPLSKPEDN
ncbi:bifunctional metallophosphatase/5'-nucleotidase [Paraferrimonas haliotis]|uniref:bifunctional metallophosphatase/5'-nucleotidase n=1 Tax=Paraferrimonas haliotis TaxID=2013866 RepID=UPI000BA9C6DF|nr:5'-nucleotidase C-terminal domain-containing protein [Paraferrimonas haliotis]